MVGAKIDRDVGDGGVVIGGLGGEHDANRRRNGVGIGAADRAGSSAGAEVDLNLRKRIVDAGDAAL